MCCAITSACPRVIGPGKKESAWCKVNGNVKADLMDTVAVYYEKPIRTYGLEAKNGYTLVHLNCPTDYLTALSNYFG